MLEGIKDGKMLEGIGRYEGGSDKRREGGQVVCGWRGEGRGVRPVNLKRRSE